MKIVDADTMPRAKDTDSHIIEHGYAVVLSGLTAEPVTLFFRYLEPAVVFGRAARMSRFVKRYGVFPAAIEHKHLPGQAMDEVTLHVLKKDSLDRKPGELDLFRRWISGIDPDSSHWHPERLKNRGRRK